MVEQGAGADLKEYTVDEIKTHNTKESLWLIVEGKVYDVTKYVDDHPGGDDIMLENSSGKDATEAYEDADHGKRAKKMMEDYLIGTVAK